MSRDDFLSRLDLATDRFLRCAAVIGVIGVVEAGLQYYLECEGGTTLLKCIVRIVMVVIGVYAFLIYVSAIIAFIGKDNNDANKPEFGNPILFGLGIYFLSAVSFAIFLVVIGGAAGAWWSSLSKNDCGPISMSFLLNWL